MGIDILVAVHFECIFNPRVKANAKKILSKFSASQTYYVFCDSPILDPPRNHEGMTLPEVSYVRRVYLIGMLKSVCVKKHADFLAKTGYGKKIYCIDRAIQE